MTPVMSTENGSVPTAVQDVRIMYTEATPQDHAISPQPMLIDRYLPKYNVHVAEHCLIDARPDAVFAAIKRANLMQMPVTRLLFGLRALGERLANLLHGDRQPPPQTYVTFADVLHQSPFFALGEIPNEEMLAGAVGQFWRPDYGWIDVAASDFAAFDRPGYAKSVAGFSIQPYGTERSILTYESRTALTDELAHRRFLPYWIIILPGVCLIMRETLRVIKAQAVGRS